MAHTIPQNIMERIYLQLSNSGDVHGMIHIIRSCKEKNGDLPSFAANALHVACFYRDLESVKTLVEEFRYSLTRCSQLHRDEINQRSEGLDRPGLVFEIHFLYNIKNTPLHCLVSSPSKRHVLHVTRPVHDVVPYLVERDPTVVEISNSEHELPLHVAIKHTMPLEVLKLVSSVNVNAQTASGDTALHLACEDRYYGDVESIMQFLIVERKCDVSIVNNEGNLPLHVAIKSRRLIMSVTPKLFNCDVNTQNNDGNTPLHLACQSWNHDNINFFIRFLTIEHSCDTSIANNEGNLPLHIAISEWLSLDIVKLVCNCSIVNTQNKNGDTPLHLACKSDCAKNIMNFLTVEQKCDTSIVNNEGNLPLHVAIKSRRLIMSVTPKLFNCDVNTQNNDGNTPLHLACQSWNHDNINFFIRFLTIEHSCDTSIANNEGNLPLHIAISEWLSLDIVKLLSNCSIVNTQNKNGDTPLHLASKTDCAKNIMNFLTVEQKCDTSIVNNEGNLPLHIAFSVGLSLDSLKLLSDCSIVNTQNKNGDTPLHLACKTDCAKNIMNFLTVEQKCNTSIVNNEGNLPLHIAFSRRLSLDIVKLVCNCSIVNTQNKNGDTPLHLACKSGCAKNIMNFLTVEQKCDTSIVNNEGNLPLHIAFSRRLSLDIVKLVCNCSIVNTQNKNGDTPLHLACKSGCAKNIMNFLTVEQKCDTSIVNNEGNLPLHIAFSRRLSLDIVKLVCNCSIVNTQNKNGDTPLHLACKSGCAKNIMNFLTVEQKCDTSIVNNEGNLPLHIAITGIHHQPPPKGVDIIATLCNCDTNTQNSDGNTPLHLACQLGNLCVVEYITKEQRCDTSVGNSEGNLLTNTVAISKQLSLVIVEPVSKYTNVNIQNSNGDTPLHLACKNDFGRGIVEFLTLQQKCDVSIVNNEGNLPLHVAISKQLSLETIKLVSSCRDLNVCNKDGDTPLKMACASQMLNVVKFLVEDIQCDLTFATENSELPLHYACQYLPLEIVTLICDRSPQYLNAATHRGDTPLHMACLRGCLDIVKYLVDNLRCDMDILNEDCYGALHVAIKAGHTQIARYLIEEKLCNLLLSDNRGALSLIRRQLTQLYGINIDPSQQATRIQCDGTLLHFACRFNKDDLLRRIAKVNRSALLVSNTVGKLPIHIACQQHSARSLKLVAEDGVNAKTDLGNTPLHECCRTSTSKTLDEDCEIIKHLFQRTDCDPNIQNNDGLTPLHFVVSHASVELVQLLVVDGKADPNITDNHGQTPIMYARDNPPMLKVLLQHGADPSRIYELYKEYFRANSSENPPETPLKILVTGNASTGKTTVIESLKCEAGNRPQPARPHTAGIIPSKFNSEIYGLVTWYDFAGQPEYYASNEAILQQVMSASPPVVLLLVDISQSEKDIEEKTLYWLTFIEHQCKSDREKPLLIIVGSHADKLRELNQDPLVKMEDVMKRAKCRLHTSKLEFVCSVVMDCRLPDSPEISELQKALKTCSEKLQSVVTLNFTSHCFYVFLLDKFKSRPAVTIDEVVNCCEALKQYGMDPWSQDQASIENSTPYESMSTQWPNQSSESDNENSDNDEPLYESESESDDSQSLYEENEELELKQANPISLLPTRPSEIVTLCEELNKRDHLILLRDSLTALKSWLILDKEFLLSEVNGTVFAPKNFTQHRSLASSTGVVAFDKFKEHFPEHDPNMLVKFLSHLEFCREIEDAKVLDLLQQESTSSSSRYFFFPGLIQIEKPEGVWKHDAQSKHYYSSGWVLECSKSGNFFTPRFIQVLLLRLVFTFALALPQRRQRGIEHPAVKRQCSVWKNGLSWLNSDGIETVVVMAEQSQAVHVMMRSQCDTPKKIAGLRSSVIKKVLDTAQDFNNHSTTDYLTDPNDLQCPPKSCEDSVLFSLTAVAEAVLQKPHCLISDGLKCHHQIAVKELLHSEPFAELSTDVLKKLFDNQVMGEVIPADFQYKLMASVQENADKTLLCQIFDCQTPSQLQSTLRKRRLTYGQLKEELGRHSVFCRRNIVVRSCREFKHHLITINNNIKVV